MIAQNPSWGKRKDGSEFFAEAFAAKWKAEEGSIMSLTLRDITQRHMIETALRRREGQYRSVIETAFDAIITVDSQAIILSWNKATELVLGYSADEIINKSFLTIIPERFHASQFQKLQYCDNGPDILRRGELPVKRKDGTEIFAESSLSKWESQDGVYFTAFIRDITDRKLTEESLKQSEERYRLTADMVPIHLGATDQSYKYSLWNKYSENMFGYTKEEALNQIEPS